MFVKFTHYHTLRFPPCRSPSCLGVRSGLAAGVAIGMVGDVGTRALGQQPKLFVGMILILIFAEVTTAACAHTNIPGPTPDDETDMTESERFSPHPCMP